MINSINFRAIGIKEATDSVAKLVKDIDISTIKLGEDTASYMQTTITNQAKRGSTRKLAKSIKSYRVIDENVVFVGVGKISVLPAYWFVVNYGVSYRTGMPYIPPANLGYFPGWTAPITQNKGYEAWTHTGKSVDFLMTPKNPIAPMNYIEITLAWVYSVYNRYFTKTKMSAK